MHDEDAVQHEWCNSRYSSIVLLCLHGGRVCVRACVGWGSRERPTLPLCRSEVPSRG